MYCKNCGVTLSDNSRFCDKCGTDQMGGAAQVAGGSAQPIVVNVVNTNTNTNTNNVGAGMGAMYSDKGKWATFFICFFLGYFGVHRFYVGKVGTGILYLCTGGLFGIGWGFDLVMILIGSFRDKANLPLR